MCYFLTLLFTRHKCNPSQRSPCRCTQVILRFLKSSEEKESDANKLRRGYIK